MTKPTLILQAWVPLYIIVFMAIFTQHGEAITCSRVNLSLAPCLLYLMNGGNPSSMCCDGLKSLKKEVPEKVDRQAACRCLQETASENPSIKDDNASQLPSKCGVDFGVPFTRSTDCDSVN